MRDHRRLAAIVSLDVAGYSRLMGQDDSGTLAALKTHRRELVDAKIVEYGGRIVKTTGDGLLLEFPSVVDAVRCAVDVQRGMAVRNAGVAADKRLDFRIGINVGDIIIDGDDIFGDGVNVAARLESLADPGGICVSRVVRDQVLDKLNFTFEDLGAQQVKNIARAIDVFRVDLGSDVPMQRGLGREHRHGVGTWRRIGLLVLVVVVAGGGAWTLAHFRLAAPPQIPPVLSVAVLPFSAPPGDTDAERFSDALTRYLLTALPTKREYGRVLVVSAGSTAANSKGAADPRELGTHFNVRYVLDGDVLRSGDANTVNLRLVDAATRAQVWSGRETLQDADVASESSVALRRLSSAVRIALLDVEEHRIKTQPVANLTAPELVLRAFALGGEDPSLAGLTGAGKLVDEALRLEPNLVPALVLRAALINNEYEVDPNAQRDRIALEQDRYTARAVQLDASDPAAWAWRATALGSLGRWNAALEASATAIKLDPYEPKWQLLRADHMMQTARPTEALALVDRALALRPDSVMGMAAACETQVWVGQTERAIATCEKASGLDNSWWIYLSLAAAYANHGDMAKANGARSEVLRTNPGLTIAQLRAKPGSDSPEYLALAEKFWYPGLRKAGIPEK